MHNNEGMMKKALFIAALIIISSSCIKNKMIKGYGVWLIESHTYKIDYNDGTSWDTTYSYTSAFWRCFLDNLNVQAVERYYQVDSVGTSDVTSYWVTRDYFEVGVGSGNKYEMVKFNSSSMHLRKVIDYEGLQTDTEEIQFKFCRSCEPNKYWEGYTENGI